MAIPRRGIRIKIGHCQLKHHSYNIDPETIADVSLKIEGAASPANSITCCIY